MSNSDSSSEASEARRGAAVSQAVEPLGLNPGELIDRMAKLRSLLPAFAQEATTARREAARLRSQNAKLKRRIAELEARCGIARELPRQDA